MDSQEVEVIQVFQEEPEWTAPEAQLVLLVILVPLVLLVILDPQVAKDLRVTLALLEVQVLEVFREQRG